jgi:hypothetical protein
MDVLKVLGSERCYLMTDGSKVPFAERDKIFGKRGKIAVANEIVPGRKIISAGEGFIVPGKKRRKGSK